jgi:hypothetical protein
MLGNLNDMIALAGPPFVCELGGGAVQTGVVKR